MTKEDRQGAILEQLLSQESVLVSDLGSVIGCVISDYS